MRRYNNGYMKPAHTRQRMTNDNNNNNNNEKKSKALRAWASKELAIDRLTEYF